MVQGYGCKAPRIKVQFCGVLAKVIGIAWLLNEAFVLAFEVLMSLTGLLKI